jgi:uncharacterized protein YdcH (DUF465 family)
VIQVVFIHKITCGNAEIIKDATLELLLAKFEHLEGKLKAYEETNNRQQVEIEMLKNQILQNKEGIYVLAGIHSMKIHSF